MTPKVFNEAGFHKPEAERLGIEDKFEKFAELIVQECAEISEQSQWSEAKGEYYEGFNEAMIYVSNKIKEHFGVEE